MTLNKLDAAKEYALRGWPVIPVHSITIDGTCSCGAATDYFGFKDKHAMGKHPYTEHGHKDASTEIAQIEAWWTKWPEANVAIRTGKQSALVVLDVDAKNNGPHSLEVLERQFGVLPLTPRVYSGGGGLHIYFNHPGFELRGRRDMRQGIDVMADGGRIVAPPSNHKSGARYTWNDKLNPDTVPLADLPSWLVRVIRTKNVPVKRKLSFAGLWG